MFTYLFALDEWVKIRDIARQMRRNDECFIDYGHFATGISVIFDTESHEKHYKSVNVFQDILFENEIKWSN